MADINWAPGHRSIAGNEGTDRLAKEAAKEANELPERNNSTTTADMSLGSAGKTHTEALFIRLPTLMRCYTLCSASSLAYLIWIQTVCHTDSVHERLKKRILKKKSADDNSMKK